MQCVECKAKAKYILFGKSLCEKHFIELTKKAEETDKKFKEGKYKP